MSNQTHSENLERNHDYFTGRAAGENITVSGGASCVLRINSEPQRTAMGLLGNVDTTFGKTIIDGTTVRHLAYDNDEHAGDLEAGDIVEGETSGASGEVLSVDTTNKIIKLRSVEGGAFQDDEAIFSDDALDFAANANGADTVGTLLVLFEESNQNNIRGLGSMEVNGEWYDIGTSDGSASQSFACWHADVLGGVWVETGSGTGVYEHWPNIASTAWSGFCNGNPSGKLCRQTYAGSITFGDGTNGCIPPNGAKIKTPNLHLASSTTGSSPTPTRNSTWTSRAKFQFPSSGSLVVNKASFGTFHLVDDTNYSPRKFQLTSFSICAKFYIPRSPQDILFDDFICGSDGGGTGGFNYCDILTADLMKGKLELKNGSIFLILGWGKFTINGSFGLTIENVILHSSGERGATNENFSLSSCSEILIKDCVFIGRYLNFTSSSYIKIQNIQFQNRVAGDLSSANSIHAISAADGKDFLLDGFSWTDKASANYECILYTARFEKIRIRNIGTSAVPLDCKSWVDTLSNIASLGKLLQIDNVHLSNIRTPAQPIHKSSGQTLIGYIVHNFSSLLGVTSKYTSLANNHEAIHYVGHPGDLNSSTGVSTDLTGTSGMHFITLRISDTAGRIHIIFTEKTTNFKSANAYSITAGAPIFDWTGALYFPSNADEIVYETPWIKAYTGFANSDPIKSGSNTASIDCTYCLDTGSGYGSWKTASGANLSAESISASSNFRLKIKFKRNNAASATYYLNGFFISMTTTVSDWNANAPEILDYEDVTLQNIADGSKYWVKNNDTGEIVSGTQSGTADITFKMARNSSQNDLTIQVRKASAVPKYVPFEATALLVEDGVSVWVEQEPFPEWAA